MKKIFVLICLASFAFYSNLHAQTTTTTTTENSTVFNFGIKAGINNANVWDEEDQNFRANRKLGLVLGAYAALPIGSLLGFQPEILLSQKGFKGTGILLGTAYAYTRTTTHVDIPLQLQIKPAELITFLIGPQISYLIYQKDVQTSGANSTAQTQEFDNENLRKSTLGFTIGADVNMGRLVASGRLGWDFQNNNADGTSSTPRYKNQWLQLTLGYRIYGNQN